VFKVNIEIEKNMHIDFGEIVETPEKCVYWRSRKIQVNNK
jgi:hypothetical protein